MRAFRACLAGLGALGLLAACSGQAAAGMREIKSGDNYRILAETRAEPGKPLAGVLALVIEPTSGWKMDQEKGPAGLEIEAGEAVELDKKSWQKTDASWEAGGKRIRFEIPYRLKASGRHPLELKFRFVVCTDQLCQLKRFELTYPLAG